MNASTRAERSAAMADIPERTSRRPLRQRLRLPLMLLAPVLLVVGGAWFYLSGGRFETTDDAYVQAARTSVSADVAGRVATVAVRDNQRVQKGDVLYRLDDAPFRIAVADARARLAAARLQVQALKANYRQAQAEVAAAQSMLQYQTQELQRQQRLLASGIASQAQFDRAAHAVEDAKQQVAGAQQHASAALANLDGTPAIPPERHPAVQQAQAALDRALLELSYTVVKAPADGVVTQVEQLQVGDYVAASTPVFALVSTGEVWVEANFKEVQLTHMRPGQEATVAIDVYGNRSFHARVTSISPGTGSQFSALPPENATGNWVKVVQRLPVRLHIDDTDPALPLRAGLSANVSVDTGVERSLFGFRLPGRRDPAEPALAVQGSAPPRAGPAAAARNP